MTFGTLAGMMAADRDRSAGRIRGAICSIRRARRFAAALWDYVKENKDYPYYLMRDRFAGAEGKSLRACRAARARCSS